LKRHAFIESVIAITGCAHIIILPAQQKLQAAADINIVIDYKDFAVHEIPFVVNKLNTGWD
ncbi:MAG TPA: hypothetical protein VJN90_05015, partial [Candidatus Acidoferrales bacterium]|nr:hypothetical protein [Candidatus Acidoferrales bacterium]